MNKYLIEILKIQNSVILPGFGALMVPSQKTGKIVFNQHLKFNDGSLARFIAEKEGIDTKEAQNKVAKFIREIETELGKGNSYDMFEFGKFIKSKDGDVDFEMLSESINNDLEVIAEAPKAEKKKPLVSQGEILKEDKKSAEKESKKKEEKAQKEKDKAAKKMEEKEAKEQKKQAEKEKIELEEKAKNTLNEVEAKAKEAVKEAEKVVKEAEKEVEEKLAVTDKEKISPPVIASAKTDVNGNTGDKQSKNKFTPAEEEQRAADAAKATIASATEKVNTSISEIGDNVKDTKKAFDIKDTSKSPSKEGSTAVIIEKEEKKKKSKLPWIILILIIIGLAVAGYFYKNEIMDYLNLGDDLSEVDDSNEEGDNHGDDDGTIDGTDEANSTDESLNSATDSLDNGDVTNEEFIEPVEEVVEEVVEEPVKTVITGSNSGSYHLIGNAFSEKSNAENYVSSMQSKGYPAKIIGRFDGLYMVSIKSYDSNSAAFSGISSVSSVANGAWVFKWPK